MWTIIRSTVCRIRATFTFKAYAINHTAENPLNCNRNISSTNEKVFREFGLCIGIISCTHNSCGNQFHLHHRNIFPIDIIPPGSVFVQRMKRICLDISSASNGRCHLWIQSGLDGSLGRGGCSGSCTNTTQMSQKQSKGSALRLKVDAFGDIHPHRYSASVELTEGTIRLHNPLAYT